MRLKLKYTYHATNLYPNRMQPDNCELINFNYILLIVNTDVYELKIVIIH